MTSTIANDEAVRMVAAQQAVLIDVREPAEFAEGHLPGAINLPSTRFDVEVVRAFGDRALHLVCQNGARANTVAAELRRDGLHHVFVLETHMEQLQSGGAPTGWSIDRQFRFTLGLLLLVFLTGYAVLSRWFLVIPVVLCTGLIVTAIIDRCYLRMGIAKLPWNRKRSSTVDDPV